MPIDRATVQNPDTSQRLLSTTIPTISTATTTREDDNSIIFAILGRSIRSIPATTTANIESNPTKIRATNPRVPAPNARDLLAKNRIHRSIFEASLHQRELEIQAILRPTIEREDLRIRDHPKQWRARILPILDPQLANSATTKATTVETNR